MRTIICLAAWACSLLVLGLVACGGNQGSTTTQTATDVAPDPTPQRPLCLSEKLMRGFISGLEALDEAIDAAEGPEPPTVDRVERMRVRASSLADQARQMASELQMAGAENLALAMVDAVEQASLSSRDAAEAADVEARVRGQAHPDDAPTAVDREVHVELRGLEEGLISALDMLCQIYQTTIEDLAALPAQGECGAARPCVGLQLEALLDWETIETTLSSTCDEDQYHGSYTAQGASDAVLGLEQMIAAATRFSTGPLQDGADLESALVPPIELLDMAVGALEASVVDPVIDLAESLIDAQDQQGQHQLAQNLAAEAQRVRAALDTDEPTPASPACLSAEVARGVALAWSHGVQEGLAAADAIRDPEVRIEMEAMGMDEIHNDIRARCAR